MFVGFMEDLGDFVTFVTNLKQKNILHNHYLVSISEIFEKYINQIILQF